MSRESSRRPVFGIGRVHLADVIWILLATLLAGFLLRTYVVGVIRVPTSSMEATLLPGDVVLLSKLPVPTLAPPEIGDVIAIRTSLREARTMEIVAITIVKRCIAVAGDTLAISGGRLIVNGRDRLLPPSSKWPSPQVDPALAGQAELGPLVVPRKGDRISLNADDLEAWRPIIESEGNSCRTDESGKILINGEYQSTYQFRRDYCFVIGDNERESTDSRALGYFPMDEIVGKAIAVFWSVETSGPHHAFRTSPGSIRWHRIGTLIR